MSCIDISKSGMHWFVGIFKSDEIEIYLIKVEDIIRERLNSISTVGLVILES